MAHCSILAPKDSLSAHSTRRYRRILAAALSALFGKGISLLVGVITVPLTVRYLGAESYGLWITISSTVTMFFVLDLGIANTLTNLISEAYAADDRRQAAVYFATAFWVITAVVVVLGLVGWMVWPHIDWASLFHLQGSAPTRETSDAVAVAFFVFLLALPTSLASRVLGGYQELHAANFFTAAGSLFSLLAVILVIRFHGSLPVLVGTYAGSAVTANAACLLWICLFHKPWMKPWPNLVAPRVIGRIFHSGIQFFIIQLAGLVVFNSDNLVVSHYLGPAEVAPYSVAWRLVGYAAAVQALLTPALWPAFSEAFNRGDLAWVRHTFWRTMWITMGTALGFALLFAVLGRWMIRIWATNAAVPTETLMILMCVWILISTFMNNTATVLVARGRTWVQAWCSIGAAALNLGLSIWLVQRIGSSGVILGTILSYLIILSLPQTYEAIRVLKGDI